MGVAVFGSCGVRRLISTRDGRPAPGPPQKTRVSAGKWLFRCLEVSWAALVFWGGSSGTLHRPGRSPDGPPREITSKSLRPSVEITGALAAPSAAVTRAVVGYLACVGLLSSFLGAVSGCLAHMEFDSCRHETVCNETVCHETVCHETVGHETVGHETVGHETVGNETVGNETVGHGKRECWAVRYICTVVGCFGLFGGRFRDFLAQCVVHVYGNEAVSRSQVSHEGRAERRVLQRLERSGHGGGEEQRLHTGGG